MNHMAVRSGSLPDIRNALTWSHLAIAVRWVGFPGGAVENPPANAGDAGNSGSIPGLGRSSGGEHGNPLQYSCLENVMDRGALQTTVHRVAESEATEAT